MHNAAELTKIQSHHEFEDTDMIKLLLEFEGDTNVQTRLVSTYLDCTPSEKGFLPCPQDQISDAKLFFYKTPTNTAYNC